ncbi:putative two-component system response regulator LuxR [Nitrospira sp.]|nr:putative two-component system response regulator LuxR [Nitrospira sp.]
MAHPSSTRKRRGVSILVVADCELVRLGVREILRDAFRNPKIEDVSIHDAWKAAVEKRPDVVVLDLDDCNRNLSFLRELKTFGQCRGLVAVTIYNNNDFVRSAYCAGASAVVLKQQSRETLVVAIQKAADGEVWIDRATLEEVLETSKPMIPSPTDQPGSAGIGSLTQREREVLTTIAKGYRNKQIAQELGISEVTVRHHLTAIFSKLKVSDRLELLIYAHSHGLIELKHYPGSPSREDRGIPDSELTDSHTAHL